MRLVDWSGPFTKGKPFTMMILDGYGARVREIGWDRWGDRRDIEWSRDFEDGTDG